MLRKIAHMQLIDYKIAEFPGRLRDASPVECVLDNPCVIGIMIFLPPGLLPADRPGVRVYENIFLIE